MRPVIIDCDNMCHIQRHAFGDELSYQEELTGVIWGFLYRLYDFAKQFETNRFLFCWDSRKSYRKLEFPDYKANRHYEKPPGVQESDSRIYAQFAKLKNEILPAIGFKNIYHRIGWEADDIIAVVLRDLVVGIAMGLVEGKPVIISTDKDLYQLLDHCVIFRPLSGSKKELVTYKLFRERYGVTPQQWTHVRALEGDPSDNIPGIKGVGVKNAIRFVQGTLKATARIRQEITKDVSQEIIRRNVRLMDLPYAGLPSDDKAGFRMFPFEKDETLSLDAFIRICERYNFGSFLKTDMLNEWRTLFSME